MRLTRIDVPAPTLLPKGGLLQPAFDDLVLIESDLLIASFQLGEVPSGDASEFAVTGYLMLKTEATPFHIVTVAFTDMVRATAALWRTFRVDFDSGSPYERNRDRDALIEQLRWALGPGDARPRC